MRVSRRAPALLGLLLGLGALGGCAETRQVDEAAVKRLQARAAYERGLAHLTPPPGGERQPSLALSAFQEAIALDGADPLYPNALGLLLLDLGRPDMALDQFRRATELDPLYAEAHLNTGVALAEGRQWPEAVEAYRKAIALPTLGARYNAYQNLGLALFHAGHPREAEEALRFAVALEPRRAAAYYNLGIVLDSQGRRDEASRAFTVARDLEPESPFGRAAAERLRRLGERR